MRHLLLLCLLPLASAGEKIASLVPEGTDLAIQDRRILQQDERFKPFFQADGPFPLPPVREALDQPLSLPSMARRWAETMQEAWPLEATVRAVTSIPLGAPQEAADGPVNFEWLDTVPAELRGPLGEIYAAAWRMPWERLAPNSGPDPDLDLMARVLPAWLRRTKPEDLELEKTGQENVQEREDLQACAAAAARMQRADHLAGMVRLAKVVERNLARLGGCEGVAMSIDTPMGPIILRGRGNDAGEADAFLVVDFGGDDEYTMPERAERRAVRILLDLEGNDLYLAKGNFAWGCGFLGTSLLIDVSGDDDYRGKDWSLGCGLGGIGVLWDMAGRDRYYGGLGSQGVGIWGDGILRDDEGDDEYVADCFCQGFGSTAGTGALIDRKGNDLYLAGRDEEDTLRRPGTYLTLAQGAGFGHRFGTVVKDDQGQQRFQITGQLPGGIGLLFDREGDDRYFADVFGQGSAYWYSLGLLVDGGGNDAYRATWYGQGVGTHCAAGCVLDVSGNDWYFSRNTSQGCGHDYSIGILADDFGDDSYQGVGLCQGAGNAVSGLGVLIDQRGDVLYRCNNNCWGFGSSVEKHPEAAPWGFFLDFGGKNRFFGTLAPKGTWSQEPRGLGREGE